jgi:forespore regulator of the sigma-K checkpoint
MRKLHQSRILTVCSTIAILLSLMLTDGNQERVKAEDQVIQEPLTLEVVLQRIYLDGELGEEVTYETIFSLEDLKASYENWQLIDQNEEKIVFQRKVDDISPLLKTNGYFGITGDGTLSIFNGKPETNEVIQSFFQIDIKKLESRKQDELMHGIKIQTKDQYLQVIKTFETYSKAEKK